MLHHVNCSCLPQFSFFLNLSVTCWLAVGRLSVTCRSTDGRQLTDSWPTGFLGSSSSQLPILLEDQIQSVLLEREFLRLCPTLISPAPSPSLSIIIYLLLICHIKLWFQQYNMHFDWSKQSTLSVMSEFKEARFT